MSRTRVSILAAASPAVAIAAPAAQAHVTLNPRTVTANSFGRLDVRVPNERDDASTKTVVVYFPTASTPPPTSASGAGRRRSRCASSRRRSRAPTATSPRRSRRSPGARPRSRTGSLPGSVRGVRPLDADPEHAELDAVLPGPPDLQRRRGRQLERRRRLRDPAPRQRGARHEAARTRRRGDPARPDRRRLAHTPLKSVDAEAQLDQHKSVNEVRATFKAKMQTGIIDDHQGRQHRRAEVQRPDELQQGGHPRGAEVHAAAGQLQGQLARPRRRRPLREGHLDLQGRSSKPPPHASGGAMDRPRRRHRSGFALALSAVGFPSPTLFAALVVGLAAPSSARRPACSLPRGAFVAAQAVVRRHARRLPAVRRAERAAAHDWLPVTLVSAATLGLSMGAGRAARPLHAARRADGDARDDRRRRLGHRHDGRRPRRRRPPRRLHAVPARARRRAAHAAADRRLRRRRRRDAAGPAPRPRSATPRDWLLTALIAAARGAARAPRARARGHAARPDDRRGRRDARGRRVRRPARRARAGVRADRPPGRPALHARHGPPARARCSSPSWSRSSGCWSAAPGSPSCCT